MRDLFASRETRANDRGNGLRKSKARHVVLNERYLTFGLHSFARKTGELPLVLDDASRHETSPFGLVGPPVAKRLASSLEVENCRRRRRSPFSLSFPLFFPLNAFLFPPREKTFQSRYIFHWNFAVFAFRRRGGSVRESRFVFTLSLLRGELARARTAA